MKTVVKIVTGTITAIESMRLGAWIASKIAEEDILLQYGRVSLMIMIDKENIPQELIDVEITYLHCLFKAWKEARWMTTFGWLPLKKNMREVQDFLKQHGGE